MRRARNAARWGPLAAIAALALTASSAGAWFAPRQTVTEGHVWSAEADADASGHAIAVWNRAEGLFVASRTPGEPFGAPHRLTPDSQYGFSSVDVAANGAAVVAPRASGAPDLFVRDAGGQFAAATLPHDDALQAVAAVHPDGTVTAAYVSGDALHLAERPPGGDFAPIAAFAADRARYWDPKPQIARAADGTVFVVWVAEHRDPESGHSETRILASVRPPGGAFSDPARLDPGASATQPFRLALAAGARGDAVAMWGAYDGRSDDADGPAHPTGAAIARDGAWQSPIAAARSERVPRQTLFPSAAADGTLAAIAEGWPVGAFAKPGGRLGAFAELTPPVPYAFETQSGEGWSFTWTWSPMLLDAALDAHGRLVSAWYQYRHPGSQKPSSEGRLLGQLRRADGTLCEPADLSPFDARYAADVALAFDAAGGGVLVLADYAGLHVADYAASDACPPPAGPYPPPGGSPPDEEAPAATSPQVVLPARAQATADGREARPRLRCTGARSCVGWLAVRQARRIGRRARFRVGAGDAATVRLVLSRRARVALRRRGDARVRVLAQLRGGRRAARTVRVVARRR
jgi:hypothetical protein